MDVQMIHSELRQGKTRQFYIFTGPEWEVQKLYIKQIAKVAKKEVKRIDGITSVKSSNSSLMPVSYVYVCRDDKELMTEEKLQHRMDKIIGNNIFILLLTNADKRTKFYKKYKDSIVEFELLKPEILWKYIKKEIDLSDKNINKLMEICEYDYGRCLLEVDKIKHYQCEGEFTMKQYSATRYDMAFEYLLKDGTIHIPPKDAIFDFVDAILDRKVTSAFNLYHECLEVGEAPMVIISVLYNNAKAVLQVQSCESKDVSKSTGLTSWQIMNARKHVNVYHNRELLDLMELCQFAEEAIKTGRLDESFAVDYILVNIL